jgi:hypothetical protein
LKFSPGIIAASRSKETSPGSAVAHNNKVIATANIQSQINKKAKRPAAMPASSLFNKYKYLRT